jgi:hypothetical protein
MKKYICMFILTTVFALFPQGNLGADPTFPVSGTDAQSLGRGGTTIATPPGKSSALGNPATLTPAGFFALGAEHMRTRGTGEGTWVLSVIDTSSFVRGAFNYYSDSNFAGFEKNLWGVALAQTITPYLTIGESYHMGDYTPAPGDKDTLSAIDLGVLLDLGTYVSLGYVARNVYRSDSDLLDKTAGFGAAMALPWTILLAVDYEEVPFSGGENDMRAGVQFSPVKWLTGRLGFQDLADGTTYYTVGFTYIDANGTVDAAVLYDKEEERTDRIIIGFTMKM